MRRWLRRTLAAAGAVGVGLACYGGWRLGHPAMPAGSTMLPARAAPAGGVTARYFGTTTLAFGDGHDTVMVDALLSRPGLATVLFGKVASDPARVADVLGRAGIGRLDLLLVTHSHYDHILDAAVVAARTGATIVGSPSTREVALGGGVPAGRIITVAGGEHLKAGDFAVTVFRSVHSLGDRVPGAVTAPLRPPASVKDYKEGGTYAYLIEHRGLRILVHASANAVPGMYRGVHADVVFLATGGLSTQPVAFTQRYWHEVVEATGARLVVPIHWDDFLLPLDQPLQPMRRFMDDVPLTMRRLVPLAARDHVAIRYMPLIAPVDIAAAAASDAR